MQAFARLLLFLPTMLCHAAIIGNPDAPKGGKFTVAFGDYPQHLLQYAAQDEYALAINELVLEPLVELSQVDNEPMPRLAQRWQIHKDQKAISFWLNPAAKFSDGQPVTPLDVKFTWDWLRKTETALPAAALNFAAFGECTLADGGEIIFQIKAPHFQNLSRFNDFFVLPRAKYERADWRKALTHQLHGSGPYRITKVDPGNRIELERNPEYWGADFPQNKGRFNFDRVHFKVSSNPETLYQLFLRGELDFYYFMVSRQWATETNSAPYQKHFIEKLKMESAREFGPMAIAWNLRRPLFQDVRVRYALSHLMPREQWIRDFFFGQYVPAAGIVGVRSANHSPKNAPFTFDARKATQLLDAAGWKLGNDGKRVKDGNVFQFEMLSDSPALEKVLTLYQEQLRKHGIEMKFKSVEWGQAAKLVDTREFDAYPYSHGREVDPGNFAAEWGSEAAKIPGSANLTGYQDAEVDRLVKAIDSTFDKTKRQALVRQLDEKIGKDQPMSWCWEPTYFRIGYWNRFSFPGKGYFPYSYWTNVFQYWWWDAEKNAKLTSKTLAE